MEPRGGAAAGDTDQRREASQRRQQTVCAACGRTFEATSRQRYCSDVCRLRSWRQNHRPTRRIVEHACVVCGQTFLATRASRKYCSVACSQLAYRRRAFVRGAVDMPTKGLSGSYARVGEVIAELRVALEELTSRADFMSAEQPSGSPTPSHAARDAVHAALIEHCAFVESARARLAMLQARHAGGGGFSLPPAPHPG
jgi:hypothetical protein